MNPKDIAPERAADLLKRFYGYTTFRPGQREIINAVCEGRDAVVIMPTGAGKSLCYQLPALMSDGCVLVVSPLIALMEDQTAALVANGIPAAAIHSGRAEADNRAAIDAAVAGTVKLLYVSPEKVLADIDSWISRLPLALIAIDEAHCISQWGHDFRPVYTQLDVLKKKFPRVPVMALTATADRLTRDDIALRLGLERPLRWIGSFDRPNLSLRVHVGASKKQRVSTVVRLVGRYPSDTGIVYTLSRAGAEQMHAALTAAGVRSCVYHAGLSAEVRERARKAFSDGDVSVICATVAFGMGIDKSNIRWVVHNNLPGNIESYYQEIGRAGRDGLPAETILFYSVADVIARRSFIETSGRPAIDTEKLEWMQRYAEATVCRRRVLLSYFGEESEHDCGNCDVCLNPPQRFDGSTLVQKAGSAILRTDSKVGMMMLNDILRGSGRLDVVRRGFDRIKTYGAGRDLTFAQWQNYLSQMIQLGLFEIAFDDSNHLRVTPYGMRVIRGETTVELSQYIAPEGKERRKAKAAPRATADSTTRLFEQLKSVRREVAALSGVPAYVVFSDATLLDMARKRPTTEADMLEVSGVGEVKCARYSKYFLPTLRRFDAPKIDFNPGYGR